MTTLQRPSGAELALKALEVARGFAASGLHEATGDDLEALRPTVLPPGVTRVDLRPLLENNGWELLTHRMAEDRKIYIKPRD